MSTTRLELSSPLSPTECAARIIAAANPGSAWFRARPDPSTHEPIVGRVQGSSLRLRRRISYNNSFQSHFTGEMHAEKDGTRIVGTFGISPWVRGFFTVWCVGVVLIGSLLYLGMLASLSPGSTIHFTGDPLVGAAVPPLMLCIGATVWFIGRYLAREEPHIIAEALARVIEAENPPVWSEGTNK